MKTEYLFIRRRVAKEELVTEELNIYRKDGWGVVSHAEADGEYSFVLSRRVDTERHIRRARCEAAGE